MSSISSEVFKTHLNNESMQGTVSPYGHDGEVVYGQRRRYFFIVGIIALTIAAKFCWPELLGTVSYLTTAGCVPCM
jgi:hypothetical protein